MAAAPANRCGLGKILPMTIVLETGMLVWVPQGGKFRLLLPLFFKEVQCLTMTGKSRKGNIKTPVKTMGR